MARAYLRLDYKNIIRREYLKLLRNEYQITAPQMAKYLDLSCRQHYLRYENGEREIGDNVRFGFFMVFSKVFDLPIDFFERAEQDYLKAKEEYKNALNHCREAKCRQCNSDGDRRQKEE